MIVVHGDNGCGLLEEEHQVVKNLHARCTYFENVYCLWLTMKTSPNSVSPADARCALLGDGAN